MKKILISFSSHLATSINPVFLKSNVTPIFRKASTGDNTHLMVTTTNTNQTEFNDELIHNIAEKFQISRKKYFLISLKIF